MPAIFVSTSKNQLWVDGEILWEIDTTKIDNKWWEDLNLHRSQHWSDKAIMTFENIPRSAIKKVQKMKN